MRLRERQEGSMLDTWYPAWRVEGCGDAKVPKGHPGEYLGWRSGVQGWKRN